MSAIKIHAGDFQHIRLGQSWLGKKRLELFYKGGPLLGEKLDLKELKEVTIANEESVKKIGGTVGWGVAGGVLLGPVGLLAGLLLGGKKKEVTFVAQIKDGRKFMGTASSQDFRTLQAAVFA